MASFAVVVAHHGEKKVQLQPEKSRRNTKFPQKSV